MGKTTRPPVWRRCKYCRARFEITWNRGKEQIFCCANHRKLYWRYGALPFGKLMDRIEKKLNSEIRRALDPLKIELELLKIERDDVRSLLTRLGERVSTLRKETRNDAS